MSMVQVIAQSGAGGALAGDRTPFYGVKLPVEAKKLVQLSKSVDHNKLRKILKCVVSSIETGECDNDDLAALDVPQETVRQVYAGVYTLLTVAFRIPGLKPEIFKEDLQALKLPGELIADMGSAVSGSKRTRLEKAQTERRVRLPKLDSLRWRIDVTISNSSLHRALEPSLLVEMTLSDGNIKIMEVPVSKFNELRYNVAYVLKEMEDLEKRNVLKLSG